jgi:alkylation response protein AidB-like acyl-CoA dehydrogenase
MTDSLISMRSLDFLLWEWLDLEGLCHRPRFAMHSRAELSVMLDVVHQLAHRELAPHSRAGDSYEPTLNEHGHVNVLPQSAHAVRSIADAGLFSTVFDEARGGLQLPNVFHMSLLGLLMAGNMGTASYVLLTTANARMIVSFGSDAQIAEFAVPQISGQTMGTMCLSEPHAGSSLAEIRTRAEPDGEDDLGFRFRLTGNKMWISGGDQDVTDNIVHLVLAKVPGPDGKSLPGTRGISLFIVPKILPDGARNDVTVTGLNHKMGQRAMPNCALNFGEGRHRPQGRAGAVGWLVGEVGQGLPQMFQMMNEARVAVGLSGSMLAARGYHMALAYAKERVQGRAPNGGGQVAIIEHPDVKRMLLAQKAIAEGALAITLYSARLLDEEQTAPNENDRRAASALLGLLTPVTKSWPSEWTQEALHLALQTFGGAGYTRAFEIEMLYRDNRLNPIHEGTTGIHGIDLVMRKVRRDDGAAFAVLQERVHRTLASVAGRPALEFGAAAVLNAFQHLAISAARLIAAQDERRILANATSFLHALGHGVVGWLWLDQAIVCDKAIETGARNDDVSFYSGKLRAFRYFAEVELPRVPVWLAQVDAMSDVAASMPIAEF